jgi:hypothetical protein
MIIEQKKMGKSPLFKQKFIGPKIPQISFFSFMVRSCQIMKHVHEKSTQHAS